MRPEHHPDHEHALGALLLTCGALLLAGSGLLWLVGQVAAILFGTHQHLELRLDEMFGVLLRLPGHYHDPKQAWPPEARRLLPGPVGMCTALAITVWVPMLLVGWVVRRWRLPGRHRTPRSQRGPGG
jgi:hypothetical protein